jgi:hypothetical protein
MQPFEEQKKYLIQALQGKVGRHCAHLLVILPLGILAAPS